MRGQANVVATTLIITVAIAAAAAYYIYSQSLFATTSQQNAAALGAKIKLERFLKPMGGKIYPVSDSVSHFVVQLYNSGDVAIPYSFSTTPIRWYLYNNDVLVAHGGAGSLGGCSSGILPSTICTLESDVPLAEANYGDIRLVVFVNDAQITTSLQPVPFPGVPPFYIACNSCDSCNAKLSALTDYNDGTFVFIQHIDATGDCIDINGKHGLIISCLGTIVGDGSGTGITIENSSGLDIRNCDVSGFSTGIVIKDSNDLKFTGTYAHDNSIDLQLSGDVSKSCSQQDWDIRTTRGPLLLLHGQNPAPGSEPHGQSYSAIWAVGASDYSISADSSHSGGLVDPIILVCNSQNVRISDFTADTAPRGIVLYDDNSTDLEGVALNNLDTGIYSVNSKQSTLDEVNIGFSGNSAFISPEQFSWGGSGGSVTFHN